ncbi:MAG: LysR family transcriptional regulator [Pseudomonadota bacterium]
MQGLDWNGLNTLRALAQAGSYAGAAQRLGVHETTVSRHLRRLEQQLGHVLWRGPEGGLTDDGATVLRHAEAMGQEADLALAVLHGRAALRGAVRVTAVPWVVEAGLVPHLAAFRDAAPDVALSLLGGHGRMSLLHGEADIAVRLAQPEAAGDILVRRLGDIPFVVAGAGPGWIGYVPEMAHVPQAHWTEESADRVTLRLSDLTAVVAGLRAGLGRAWVPRCLAPNVDASFPPRHRPLWCLTHPRTRQAPAVDAVCRQLLPLAAATLCA